MLVCTPEFATHFTTHFYYYFSNKNKATHQVAFNGPCEREEEGEGQPEHSPASASQMNQGFEQLRHGHLQEKNQ